MTCAHHATKDFLRNSLTIHSQLHHSYSRVDEDGTHHSECTCGLGVGLTANPLSTHSALTSMKGAILSVYKSAKERKVCERVDADGGIQWFII